MAVPLPWGSPPVGNPAIQCSSTCRAAGRLPVRSFVHTRRVLLRDREAISHWANTEGIAMPASSRLPAPPTIEVVGTRVQAV